ncbi:MAG: molecular chaperone GrpE [Halieaceae bacterium]
MADQEQPSEQQADQDTAAQADADAGPKAVLEGILEEAGAADEANEAPAADSTPEEVIEQLQADLAEAQDAALRAAADAQNVKRRAVQDVEKARKFALDQFSKDLLPVVDNLERSLAAAPDDNEAVKPIAEGVELTLKSFIEVMKKNRIEVVDPAGEPFDHELHQAISMVENPDVEPNTVLAVMQKGYTLNGRLMRPAMVMVSKAAS